MTLGWHFVVDTLRDGRAVPADGETLTHDGEVKLCHSGFHGSKRIIDALGYAPGSTICRVEFGGKIIHDNDKLVAAQRTILWRVDAEEILRIFARKCALDVLHLWDAPEVVVQYLKTGDEEMRDAAGDAAWSAWAATRAKATDHVGAATWATWSAWCATRAAGIARIIAGDSAWPAARAAGPATRDTQNRRLTRMVMAEKKRQA